MDNPYIYILLNSKLNMSAGKAAAQAAHAMAALHRRYGIEGFIEHTQRTVIVLEANDDQQILNLEQYLLETGIPVASYIDEGMNEVAPYSVTALAAGPIKADDLAERELFAPFPLYGNKRKWFN